DTDPRQVGNDLDMGISALQKLGRTDEIDDFREAVIDVHKKNWRLLQTAALSYGNGEHHGFIVAGKFYRGNKRGGGRYVGTVQRDRARALQLMQQALELTRNETDKTALSQFHFHFANLLLDNSGQYESWRLQYLTDLSKLPDYQEGRYWYPASRGAPVDAD